MYKVGGGRDEIYLVAVKMIWTRDYGTEKLQQTPRELHLVISSGRGTID